MLILLMCDIFEHPLVALWGPGQGYIEAHLGYHQNIESLNEIIHCNKFFFCFSSLSKQHLCASYAHSFPFQRCLKFNNILFIKPLN